MPSLEERRAGIAEAVGAEVVDVEAKAAVVVVAWAQEEIVSALVVAQEQTRKRLLIKLSSLEILYFFENLPTYICINENSTILNYIPPILLGCFINTTLHN